MKLSRFAIHHVSEADRAEFRRLAKLVPDDSDQILADAERTRAERVEAARRACEQRRERRMRKEAA